MPRGLALRLFLSFLIVAAIAIGIVALASFQTTSSRFGSYLAQGDRARVEGYVNYLAALYSEDWRDLSKILPNLAAVSGDRLVVTDPTGVVLADSAGQLAGRRLQLGELGVALPIEVGGKRVGFLHFLPGTTLQLRRMEEVMRSMGMGPEMMGGVTGSGGMMGKGGMMGGGGGTIGGSSAPPSTPVLTAPSPESGFLPSVRRSLLLAALGAVAAAALLSYLFIRYVTRPLRQLKQAARRIASGDLSYRVPVERGDELGELSTSFNQMAHSLEKAEEGRRQLTADIAHELRTPLTVLQGNLEAMQEGLIEPTPEHLESLRQEVSLLNRLVNDLRELSLVDAGQLKLEKVKLNLASHLRSLAPVYQAQAEAKGVLFSLEVTQESVLVEGDPHRLEQVVGNLLSNALRYTPSGGKMGLTLSLRDREALVGVYDTGSGIPSEALPQVFDRFYRVDRSRSRATGGSGLGLAIVKGLVEMHRGRAWAESQPGDGSRFYFTIPLAG